MNKYTIFISLLIMYLLFPKEIALAYSGSLTEDRISLEDRIESLRKHADKYFIQKKYRKAYEKYKEVAYITKNNLNDLRNCSDACHKVVSELQENSPEYNLWMQKCAVWASRAANHNDSSAEDLRNAAKIYFSSRQYQKACETWEKLAENSAIATWDDFKKTALSYYKMDPKSEKAKEWFIRTLNHPNAPAHHEEIEKLKDQFYF